MMSPFLSAVLNASSLGLETTAWGRTFHETIFIGEVVGPACWIDPRADQMILRFQIRGWRQSTWRDNHWPLLRGRLSSCNWLPWTSSITMVTRPSWWSISSSRWAVKWRQKVDTTSRSVHCILKLIYYNYVHKISLEIRLLWVFSK